MLQSSLRSSEAADVFSQLFASWSYSCAASMSLALLAQVGSCPGLPPPLVVGSPLVVPPSQGRHPLPHFLCDFPHTHTPGTPPSLAQAHSLACELLAAMAQEPLSMRPETTVELTQLVSLLEAPAFAPLRLQLLQPHQFPALQRAVHGLLMLLPQARAGWGLVGAGQCCWAGVQAGWASRRLHTVGCTQSQVAAVCTRRGTGPNVLRPPPRPAAGRRIPHAPSSAGAHPHHGAAVPQRGASSAAAAAAVQWEPLGGGLGSRPCTVAASGRQPGKQPPRQRHICRLRSSSGVAGAGGGPQPKAAAAGAAAAVDAAGGEAAGAAVQVAGLSPGLE